MFCEPTEGKEKDRRNEKNYMGYWYPADVALDPEDQRIQGNIRM
jgi:hypothetical protein